jgi:DNA-directed RNA polymerase specialized sigma24 family protein
LPQPLFEHLNLHVCPLQLAFQHRDMHLWIEDRHGGEAKPGQLPRLQREAIIMFTFEELSLEEIAKITGVDAGAVKSRLNRARESLRRALAPLLVHDPEGRRL